MVVQARLGARAILAITACVALVGAAGAAAGAASPRAVVQGENAFDHFEPSRTGHSWTNSYLLSYLSDRVYGAPGASWTAFRNGFRSQVGPLAPSGEEFTFDFVRSIGTGTEVAIVTDSRSVVVVFRGTESSSLQKVMTDWGTDGNALLLAAPSSWGSLVRVHAGFAAAVDSVYAAVRTTVINRRAGTKRVWLTGHSLGGALATVTAYRLRRLSGIPIQGVHTYGQPRVGNFHWRTNYNSFLGSRTQRWGHTGDPVVHLPPGALPGQALSGYYHVGRYNRIAGNGSITLNAAEALSQVKLAHHATYTTRLYNRLASSVRAAMPK